MSATQQNVEPEVPEAARLEKLSKKELVELIGRLNHRVQQDERKKQWGDQFDVWLIRCSRKNQCVVIATTHEIYDRKGMVFSTNTIVGIPTRVDKDQIQLQLKDSKNLVWINKSIIGICYSENSNLEVKEEIEEIT
jgi:hypothetical protein